jgi:hypothetical protein
VPLPQAPDEKSPGAFSFEADMNTLLPILFDLAAVAICLTAIATPFALGYLFIRKIKQ